MKTRLKEAGDAFEILIIIMTGLIIIGILALAVGVPILKQSTHRTETITVDRSERVTESKSSHYLIWTNKGVYENADSFLNGKFNSSDLYGSLKNGKTYDCDVIGWRIPFLSWYPNLLSCSETKS